MKTPKIILMKEGDLNKLLILDCGHGVAWKKTASKHDPEVGDRVYCPKCNDD